MIELLHDELVFSFPEVHEDATLQINFQRTLRIPDDGKSYPLPPGFGRFPLRHVDDNAERVPEQWLRRGGVMLPMYQSEAMWLSFSSYGPFSRGSSYPFAVLVAAGKINAVTGGEWSPGLGEEPQNYLIVPKQPWLDGYCVEKGYIRQFVAMPLGAGYTAEEQITGEAVHGGVQIMVFPMKPECYERRFPEIAGAACVEMEVAAAPSMLSMFSRKKKAAPDMGLAPGGRMKQEIFEDEFGFDEWDTEHSARCFVHLTNSLSWRAVTGGDPPTVPFTAREYTKAGLPWFDYYDDGPVLAGSEKLKGLKSVAEMAEAKDEPALPENESVTPQHVRQIRSRMKKDQVREGSF